jgi:hypothetical protein
MQEGDLPSPETDVMIFKIFSAKKFAKKFAIFFAENCRKSQKIVIITSPSGRDARLEVIFEL